MSDKVSVFCKKKKRTISVKKKVAEILVRMNIAEYLTKPLNVYNNRMMSPTPPDDRALLRGKLDAAGIKYDGRMGETRLKQLLDSIVKE